MGVVDRCLIATDSDEIAEVARRHHAEVVLTAASHPSGTDRVAEVASRPEFRQAQAILNIQGDEPFVTDAAVRGALALVASGTFSLGTAAARAVPTVDNDPNVVKVVAADDQRAMYFSRAPIPFLQERADAPLHNQRVWHHIGVYAYAPLALAKWVALPQHPLEQIERLEQLRPLAAGLAMGVALVGRPPRGGVDTLDDLARANAAWSDFTKGQI